jgi:hypothetical protein
MIEVKASMNNKNVYKHLLQLKGANQKAAVRSLNRIAKGAKAAASSDLRDRLNIKKRDLEKDMKVKTANYSNPIAQIITVSKSKGIGLYKFGGRWSRTNKKGASFMMRKGSRKYIAESFIATMPNQHKGIYLRFGDKKEVMSGKYAGQKKQGLKEKFGPSAAKLMRSRRVKNVIDNHISKNWNKQYESDLKYYLRQK